MKVRVQDYCYGCSACNGPMLFENDSRVATCRTENCRLYEYPLIIPEQFVEARPLYPTASGIESQEHKDAQRAVNQGRSRVLDAAKTASVKSLVRDSKPVNPVESWPWVNEIMLTNAEGQYIHIRRYDDRMEIESNDCSGWKLWKAFIRD